MNTNDLSQIRLGAEMQNMKPYMDNEISSLQKSVVSFILSAVNAGTLTPEIAMSKWVEYVSYSKLQQRINQRIEVGKSVGGDQGDKLDFLNKVR